jgi:hypothetical protein
MGLDHRQNRDRQELALPDALGHTACCDDPSVLYYRVARLLDVLALARGDGRYPRLIKGLVA